VETDPSAGRGLAGRRSKADAVLFSSAGLPPWKIRTQHFAVCHSFCAILAVVSQNNFVIVQVNQVGRT